MRAKWLRIDKAVQGKALNTRQAFTLIQLLYSRPVLSNTTGVPHLTFIQSKPFNLLSCNMLTMINNLSVPVLRSDFDIEYSCT